MISLLFDPANYQFNPYAIPTLLAATAIFTLGVWVILREVRSQVSWLLFAISMAVGIWLFCNAWMYFAVNPATALWWAKLTYLGVAFIPPAVYHFTVAVLLIDRRSTTQIRISWALAVLFLSVVLTTDGLTDRVHRYWWGYYPLYNWLAVPFLGFFFTLMVVSLRHYWIAYQEATEGTHKLRIKAFMTAFAVAYLGSWDYLAAYGVAAYPFGYLCIIGFLALTVRAVWRYRLVDIRSAFTAGQILETMQGAVLVVDQGGRIGAINPPACTMFGYRETELIGRPIAMLIPSPSGNGSAPAPGEAGGAFRDREMTWRTRDGRRLDVVVSASVIMDRDDFPVGTVYVAQDITERKQAEESLRLLVDVTATANESGEFYAMISRCLERICVLKRWQVGQAWFVDAAQTSIVCPAEAHYAEINVDEFRRATSGFHLPKGGGLPGLVWASGTPIWAVDIAAELAFPRARQAHEAGLKAACAFPIMVDEHVFAVFEFFSQEARSPDPHFLSAAQKLGVHLGIVFGRRRAQEALAEQAIRDTLTGLYNRRYFDRRVEEEFARADRHHHALAFLLCDVDNFKKVNDTRGHHMGDQILKAVAAQIQEATRETDLVFRWGGDEIVVVLPEASRERVFTAAERIRNVVRAVGDREQAAIDLSIGVALYPEHGDTIDQLIRFADRALYIAKKGGDKVHIGEEEYHLNADAVTVVFQPVVEIGAGRIIGYEALSRDPNGKLTIQELFNRYQAIGQLQELKRVCFESQLRAATESGLARVFINVDFDLLNQLTPSTTPPGTDVILEISEREALHDIEAHLRIAETWRRHGFRLAIDDFGAGFVSLPFIARLTPDYIKVDRSMTLHAVSSKQFKGFAKDLVRALHNYAAEGIIAEGIETDRELAVVKEMGIGLVQGFLLDRLSAGWEANGKGNGPEARNGEWRVENRKLRIEEI